MTAMMPPDEVPLRTAIARLLVVLVLGSGVIWAAQAPTGDIRHTTQVVAVSGLADQVG